MVIAGCASLPATKLGAPSRALPARDDDALARIVARSAPDRELSGFRLMPGGDFALDTRLQLIRRAEHSLDLQYYQVENDGTEYPPSRMPQFPGVDASSQPPQLSVPTKTSAPGPLKSARTF